jgi:putative PIN family toxin of toxin-antitoxin system
VRVVLDTNILVSGIWNPHGAPGQIVDLLLNGAFILIYDDRIMSEYEDVLSRPKFHFPKETVRVLLDTIQAQGERLTSQPCAVSLTDPDDRPFLEVALSGQADALVTDNEKHFPHPIRPTAKVMSPTRFLELRRKIS